LQNGNGVQWKILSASGGFAPDPLPRGFAIESQNVASFAAKALL